MKNQKLYNWTSKIRLKVKKLLFWLSMILLYICVAGRPSEDGTVSEAEC